MSDDRPAFEPELPEESAGGGLTAPPEQRIGAWKRLVLVFTSPTEVFADIGRKPTWAACLILTTLLGVGASLVAIPHLDMEATIRSRMERRGRTVELSDQQMDRILKRAHKFAYVQPVAAAVAIPLASLVVAGFYLLLLKLAGSEADFLHVLSAYLHAMWPAGFTKTVLSTLLIARSGRLPAQELGNILRSNVAAFLPSGAPVWLHSLGRTLDVFNVWAFVLLVIGMSAACGIGRKKSAVAVSLAWVLFILVKVGLRVVLPH